MSSNVSITKYTGSPDSLRKSIDLCAGLQNLKQSDQILIKPNLVVWEDIFPIAPFGVYTTTRLVEDLIICLKDFGCRNIRIGEGSVENNKKKGTGAAFEGLGYKAFKKKYGVTLIDFNESDADEFLYHGEHKLHIAKEAVESDFFINFPVLKTHSQTKISLGTKNLKGCLKLKSKRHCHNPESNLEFAFSHIADIVKPDLTIIDGVYALERGPLHFGKAYRKDLIIASTDMFAADLIGAHIIGYSGADIGHLSHYAQRHAKPLTIDQYSIIGENISDHVQPLKWDWRWTNDNTGPGIFEKLGITGVALPKYDETLCSRCANIPNITSILTLSAFKGKPLPKVEILNGKKMQARAGYEKTILLGNCIIKANRDNKNINEAIWVKGCPPPDDDIVSAMQSAGLDANILAYHGFLKQESKKYEGKIEFDRAFFNA